MNPSVTPPANKPAIPPQQDSPTTSPYPLTSPVGQALAREFLLQVEKEIVLYGNCVNSNLPDDDACIPDCVPSTTPIRIHILAFIEGTPPHY